MSAIFYVKYTNTLNETSRLEVLGFIRGSHTNSNRLMYIVRDGDRVYETAADDSCKFDGYSDDPSPPSGSKK
jgi:hypothetical protein